MKQKTSVVRLGISALQGGEEVNTAEAAFDRHLDLLPGEWKGPLVDVLDTAYAVRMRLREWGIENDATALVGMTRLVMEEHRIQQQQKQHTYDEEQP